MDSLPRDQVSQLVGRWLAAHLPDLLTGLATKIETHAHFGTVKRYRVGEGIRLDYTPVPQGNLGDVIREECNRG